MLFLASSFMPPELLACTDRSRMRCRIECVSVSAPSDVCTTEMPSCVLRTATFRPPICERRPSEMARPAASSAARLMRKPEDSFSSDFCICPSVTDRLRYALSAAMLLLTRRPMVFLLGRGLWGFPLHPCCGPCLRSYGAGAVELRRNRRLFSHPSLRRVAPHPSNGWGGARHHP